jgi:hypothetical protein
MGKAQAQRDKNKMNKAIRFYRDAWLKAAGAV